MCIGFSLMVTTLTENILGKPRNKSARPQASVQGHPQTELPSADKIIQLPREIIYWN